MELENKFCCNGLKSKIKNTNKKGFSIVFNSNEPHLVFNSIDSDSEEILVNIFKEKLLGEKLPSISLSGKIVISYCPFCGKKLFS